MHNLEFKSITIFPNFELQWKSILGLLKSFCKLHKILDGFCNLYGIN